MTRRDFLKLSGRTVVLAGLAASAGVGYVSQVEPGWLSIEQVRLSLPRLPRAFDGYRVVHFSDIHMGGWMNFERLQRAADLILEQTPDLLLITGDFLIGRGAASRRRKGSSASLFRGSASAKRSKSMM
mgnify:CR=1 FL=1